MWVRTTADGSQIPSKKSHTIISYDSPLNGVIAALSTAFGLCGMQMRRWRKFVLWFGLDPRAMAAFRVGVAVILILNLYNCAVDMHAWFADDGVWPTASAMLLSPQWWSLHFINGTAAWQAMLFGVSLAVHAMMLVGYQTTFATVMSWFMHTSMQNRNLLILNGGDVFLRMSLFWCMMMPLGKMFSVDSVLKRRQRQQNPTPHKPQKQETTSSLYISFASIGFVFQVWVLYVFTYFIKTGQAWRDGSAVYLALSLDNFTTRTGYIVYQFPWLMWLLTHVTIWLELLCPMFLVMPFWTEAFRILGVIGLWCMHLGFGMCMEIGLFPFLPQPITMILLPSIFWDKAFGWYFARRARNRAPITIYVHPETTETFKTTIDVFKTLLLPADCTMVEDHATHPKLTNEMTSRGVTFAVVDGDGQCWYGNAAVPVFAKASWLAWPLAPLLRKIQVPLPSLQGSRDLEKGKELDQPTNINTNTSSRPTRTTRSRQLKKLRGFSREAFFLLCLIIVVDWNYSSFFKTGLHLPHGPTFEVVHGLRLDQWWGMFSPQPPTDDGWFVIPAKLTDGSEIDLYKEGAPVSWEKPYLQSHTYPTEKWRKYMMNLYSENLNDMKLGYGRYLCRRWNWYGRLPEGVQVKTFQIVYNREFTLPDYQSTPVEKVVIWEHNC